MESNRASQTAVIVCQGRAAANGRLAPGRFSDPVAMALLQDAERVPVNWVRDDSPPAGMAKRFEFEMVRASAEVMVPRTVAIDDAIRAHPTPQLVVLGAGLDTRAWRMRDLTAVFEVDHPATQESKRDRVTGLTPVVASLSFVRVDFAIEPVGAALAAAGHREDLPTTWVWEGVVPYLTRAEVDTTTREIGARSVPGSWLIVNYQVPAVSDIVGRLAARAVIAASRRRSPWAAEPRRSAWTPGQLTALLAKNGFLVQSDEDLLAKAVDMGLRPRQRRPLLNSHVMLACREAMSS
jgi:methyltransferase (TIGR00027 family)